MVKVLPKTMRNAGIVGVGSAIPDKILTNQDLEKMVETSDEWIVTRTGISERRIAPPEIKTSDLAVEAARKAMQDANVTADQIDLVIVATVTPDSPFPSTASLVQDKLGAKHAAAFDLEAGCSGFIYASTVGAQFVETGLYNTVLVIGADLLSRATNWKDRRTCVLFGDAAGAAIIRPVSEGNGFLSYVLGSDGSGGNLLCIEAGGSAMPATAETVEKELHYIQMSGAEVFKFAVRIMEEAANQVLEKAGLSCSDVDCLIPHQANIRIIDAAAKRLDLSRDKVFVNVQKYGNTSAASIPLALDEAVKSGRAKHGDLILMVGFGAGLTWGASLMRY